VREFKSPPYGIVKLNVPLDVIAISPSLTVIESVDAPDTNWSTPFPPDDDPSPGVIITLPPELALLAPPEMATLPPVVVELPPITFTDDPVTPTELPAAKVTLPPIPAVEAPA